MCDLLCFGTRIRAGKQRKGSVPASTPLLCSTCSELDLTSILRNGISKQNAISLGSLVVILRRADQCRFCNLVASLFQRYWCLDTLREVDLSGVECFLIAESVGALANPRLENRKQCHRLRIEPSNRPTAITDTLTQARMDLTLDIQLMEEDAHKVARAKEIHGRRMTGTVDMELIKSWIVLCEHEHKDACESVWWRGRETQLPSFVRMLDVTLMSVVRAPFDCRYVALSYVWGTAGDSYWTTMNNVEARAQSAGLDLSVLPDTIKDAIHLTRALGERYLWIDALCIIQDSSDDKNDQIHAMELIYSGASFAIVAAGGENAHSRLPGFSADSRHLHQQIEVIQGLHLAIPLPSLDQAITQSTWNTRAWTFQELLLSRRRVFFTKYQVYFECTKDVWCEDVVAESKTVQYSHHPMRYRGSGGGLMFLPKQPAYPDLDYITTYNRAIERYTQRRLTYPSDILHAVTALTSAMTKAYRLAGGDAEQAFRYGMQIWNLNHSLLWQPRLDSAHARRVGPDARVSPWPSWSWAAWTGAVSYSDLSQLMTMAILTSSQGKPDESLVTQWYIVSEHGQLIHLEVERIRFISFEGPDVQVRRRKYLVPAGEIDTRQQRDPIPPSGTLVFRTQCASFKVSKLEEPSSGLQDLPNTLFKILSDVRQSSVHVGRMILPSSTPSPTVLEFLVLSRGGDISTSGLYDDSIYGSKYDGCLLNVMAVKTTGDDAKVRERVGLGVMFEQAWLERDPDVETVFLG